MAVQDTSLFATPERAICAFEGIHQLRVTIHDLRGSLVPFLLPDRFYHHHPLCHVVKAMGRDRACVDFEVTRLRRALPTFPEGRVHVCHAGLLEWVVPVFADQQLEWVLFAGVRRVGASLCNITFDRPLPLPPRLLLAAQGETAVVEEEESQRVLEHLRQLAARLRLWYLEAKGRDFATAGPLYAAPPDTLALRRTAIQRFIHERHTHRVRLRELAKHLCLSEDRTSHVVRDCFDRTFQDLVTQARLQTAQELLRHSTLPLAQVAVGSGFPEVTHFHRLFRRHVGMTPHQYRRNRRTARS